MNKADLLKMQKRTRRRYPTWVRQSCYCCMCLMLLWKLIETKTFDSDVLFITVLLFSIIINSEPGTERKYIFRWLLLDIVQLFYTCVELFSKHQLGYGFNSVVLVFSSVGCFVSIVDAMITPDYKYDLPLTVEYTCNLFQTCTFSFLNNILIIPGLAVTSLELEDLPTLMDIDTSNISWRTFKKYFDSFLEKSSHNDSPGIETAETDALMSDRAGLSGVSKSRTVAQLIFAVMKLIEVELWGGVGLAFGKSLCRCITPLALQRVLEYVSHSKDNSNGDGTPGTLLEGVDVYTAVFMMFVFGTLMGVFEGQQLSRGRHMGIRVRGAIIGAVINKAFTVDTGEALRDGLGKLNNLISVDVDAVMEYMCYTSYSLSSLLDLIFIVVILCYVLGWATIGGLIVLCIGMPTAVYIATIAQEYQADLLKKTDIRMSLMNEAFNGIRIIKLFAWEDYFRGRVSSARKHELLCLVKILIMGAVSQLIWKLLIVFVLLGAFCLHVFVLGLPLTPTVAFTSMCLFASLKDPMDMLPWVINQNVVVYTSFCRIHEFLSSSDVDGLKKRLEGVADSISKKEEAATVNSDARDHLKPNPHDRKYTSSLARSKFSYTCSVSGKRLIPVAIDICGSFGWNQQPSEDVMPSQYEEVSCCECFHSGCNALCFQQCFRNIGRDVGDGYSKVSTDAIDQDGVELSNIRRSIDNGLTGDVEMGMASEKETMYPTQIHPIVKDCKCQIPLGGLVVVAGITGCGKSTFLLGLVGESRLIAGSTAATEECYCSLQTESIAYVPQSPWIFNATIRENILFGNVYCKEKYEQVLFACALIEDLKQFEHGDLIEIGEKGVNLSGGQQQRVGLARAAYQCVLHDKTIILLDDPLSAVDAHVGSHIFKYLLCKLLKDCTRVLVTHQLAMSIPSADYVLCMGTHGSILAYCPPDELSLHLSEFIGGSGANGKPDEMEDLRSGSGAGTGRHGSNRSNAQKFPHEQEDVRETSRELESITEVLKQSSGASGDVFRGRSGSSCSIGSTAEVDELLKTCVDIGSFCAAVVAIAESVPALDSDMESLSDAKFFQDSISSIPSGEAVEDERPTLVSAERKDVGEVPLSVYLHYYEACGGVVGILLWAMLVVGISVSMTFQNYYLGTWVKALELQSGDAETGTHVNSNVPFRWYMVFVFVTVIASIASQIMQLLLSVRGSQELHDGLATSVFMAPISWFDSTPVGRITNRFSSDMNTVDRGVMYRLAEYMDCFNRTLNIVVVIGIFQPLILVMLVPVMVYTFWVAYQYLHVSRDIKRLESITRSPVYALCGETMQGVGVIRAFQREEHIFQKLKKRLDDMNRCHLYLWLCNRWLTFRMTILGTVVASVVSLVVVMNANTVGSTAAGLMLVYSLDFTSCITFFARSHADVQINMNSVERVKEYSDLMSEKYFPTQTISESATNGRVHNPDAVLKSAQVYKVPAADAINVDSKIDSIAQSLLEITKNSQMASSTVPNSDLSGVNASWPAVGEVEFKHVSLRYKSSGKNVLNDVNFLIPGGSSVGVVGRSGAGKSSLIAALFRIVEPIVVDGGNSPEDVLFTRSPLEDNASIDADTPDAELEFSSVILVDGVNILDLPLHTVRSNIAIVPQDPVLFKGSIRNNLDPLSVHSDMDIITALEKVQMMGRVKEFVARLTGDATNPSGNGSVMDDVRVEPCDKLHFLDAEIVEDRGCNFSLGQRQLLCLGRAMLRGTSILVMDEATANVDVETDALIQETIKREFADVTVFCIAHRLHTVAPYDAIIVMDKGCVAEYGAPYDLLCDSDGLFKSMCVKSGDYENIFNTLTRPRHMDSFDTS